MPLRTLGSVEVAGAVDPDSYLGQLLESFEFVDFWDLLVAFAVENATPWTRYDEPGQETSLAKWRRARAIPLSDAKNPERTPLEILHAVLSGNDESFRGHPVIGGGDERVDGPEVQGFYVITASQKAALERNPFLDVAFRPGKPGSPLWFAKHEYPSARNYARIRTWIEPSLLQELDAATADGSIKDATAPRFAELTRRLIRALVVRTTADPALSPTEAYQQLMSIHPFGDFNGRTLRMAYERRTGHALFLKVWDWDLFMQPAEFAEAVRQGQADLEEIRQGFLEEQIRNPDFPRFFASPAPWRVAAGPGLSTSQHARAKDLLLPLFRDDLVLKQAVDHKSHLDIFERIQKALNN
jgi:hypothetical protein